MGALAGLVMQVTYTSEETTSSTNTGAAAAIVIIYLVVAIAFAVIMIASMWKLFSKAGQPGWAAIIPVLREIVLWRLLKVETYWLILVLVPCTAIAAAIAFPFFLARAFGKSMAFGVGILLLPMIFLPILAFGSAQYQSEPNPLF